MLIAMNRFSTARRHERGATLTGYALLMSGLVVISLGAIGAMNESSEAVLTDTGASVGNPRLSVEETKANPVPGPPPWVGARGDGTCSAGFDGCPLGTRLAFNPANFEPPGLSGDILWGGSADNVDFATLGDDATAFVMIETVVQLNGEWQPPQGDSDGNPGPILAQPGDKVCTYIVHASPIANDHDFSFGIDFQGEVLGTAYNSEFGADPVFQATGATFPVSNYIEAEDDFEISGASLGGIELKNNAGSYDEIRVFVRC